MTVMIRLVATKDKDSKYRLSPAPSWFGLVRIQWARLGKGEKGEVKSAADLPKQTAGRVVQQIESGAPGEPVSFDVYERLRLALNAHKYWDGAGPPDPVLPPPFTTVLDAEDWAWIEAGRRVRAAAPDAWPDQLSAAEKTAAAAETMSRKRPA
jgi:hypothetical protein